MGVGARTPDCEATVSRRELLRTAGGATAAVGAAAGASRPAAAQEGEERLVEMTDDLVFVPEELTVAPGDTVVWENVGQIGHSVTAYGDEIPEEAEYFASGGFESEQAARDAYPEGDVAGGESYRHTFEAEGTYGYFCIPHEAVGMVGEVTVTAAPQAEAGPASILPDSAKTIAVAATSAMATVLGLAYFFMKYGGAYGELGTEIESE